MEYVYNDKGLAKHRVSRLDVDQVLSISNSSTRDFDLDLGLDDHLRIMFVGYNHAGRLLEVGVEFFSEEKAIVFHGQAVSPKYKRLYEEAISNG